ncbi:uncharacterized protein BT62DRAFT_696997 [Guyanagaster necrorhizus]|uniref:Uncharacterized protein n=1 Tax=Guyanagaster necrorhizus TaxID=856835 RepID=A0A9P8ALA5_9AGAR|nr:uncharacterized protein BT62DRAFT_696997 [Guyanagaster necrorhizus MCA 3950]KAG7439580.1 hypothetical protein BT62DRAFT_696997 [Guyanagaster necrorhizus MCA 3950]
MELLDKDLNLTAIWHLSHCNLFVSGPNYERSWFDCARSLILVQLHLLPFVSLMMPCNGAGIPIHGNVTGNLLARGRTQFWFIDTAFWPCCIGSLARLAQVAADIIFQLSECSSSSFPL